MQATGRQYQPGSDLLDALVMNQIYCCSATVTLPDNFDSTSDAAVVILALMKKELCVRGSKDPISLPCCDWFARQVSMYFLFHGC